MKSVFTRKQTSIVATVAFTMACMLLLGGKSSAHTLKPNAGNCKAFTAGAVVVQATNMLFPGHINGNVHHETNGPIPAVIPAGTYRVEAESYSDSSPQPEEQWYFDGYKNGIKVFTSATTPDLSLMSQQEQYVLHPSIALPEMDAVIFVHKLVGTSTSTTPPNNSVEPCLGFVKLATGGGDPTPTPTPEPTPAPQVVVPTKPVAAGDGGAVSSVIAPLVGLAGSVTLAGVASRQLLKRR